MIAARIHVGLISKLASLTAFLESCGAYLVLAAAATVLRAEAARVMRANGRSYGIRAMAPSQQQPPPR